LNVITVERTIDAPIERVWAVVTDLEGAKVNLKGVSKIERLAGEGYEVGTTWRETRKVFGMEATEEMTASEVEAPNRTVILANTRGIDYRTEFILAPTGAGTSLTMAFSGESNATGIKALVEKVLTPLGAAVTRKMMASDLEDIGRVAKGG
jgi:carbon monoxide dehydrogenase subunit G